MKPAPVAVESNVSTATSRSRSDRAWRIAFSIHHWAGLLTGVLFFITAVTGFALGFTEEFNLRRHPPLPSATVAADAIAPLGPMLATAVERHPGYAVASVRPGKSADLAWIVFLRHPETDHRIVVDFDPRTGAILGERDFADTPFRFLLDLHYTYFAGTIGKLASTVVSVVLVLLAVTGFVLMLTILPLTFAPAKRGLSAADSRQLRQLADTSAMQRLAVSRIPEGEVFSVTPPAPGGKTVRFLFLLRHEWPWNKRAEAVFGASTGALQRVILPHEQPAAQRFDFAVHALHYGFYGSRWTLILYALGGLAVSFLPVSGYLIWWLKRRSRA